MKDFSYNPTRRGIFDVFLIDKSETDIRVINEAIRDAKNRWRFGKLIARDGTELQLNEAQLNNMEKRLREPVERLKEEQLVHQAHHFGKDEELAASLRRLEAKEDPLPRLLAEARRGVLSTLNRFLPPLVPPRLDDDLPWPDPPAAVEPVRESFEAAILRDL